IDVEVDSENGQSFGRITIATSLDQVETAILGAALETIDRVGPCRSTIEVRRIEDVRAAKRREVVERAKTLFADAFDDSMRTSRDLVEEVREAVRVEDITDYRGLPAGPNVADSDAVVVVEGRADVLTLLRYGIKNAVAVEGTDVPTPVADLTESRTVTAFLDGDRGGELILKELEQVGDVDYVAFASEGRSVEDLARREGMAALREKVPYDRVAELESPSEVAQPTGAELGSGTVEEPGNGAPKSPEGTTDDSDAETEVDPATDDADAEAGSDAADESEAAPGEEPAEAADAAEETETVETLPGHVRAVIEAGAGRVRLLDSAFRTLEEGDDDALDVLAEAAEPPSAVVL
ncbi:hypothetical protein BRD14_06430, partial [Halobacteriales archaeon SW_5_68_122]